ncbi:hypothetical protein PC116_g30814, partial [Phytophthora cactorum]
RWGEYLGYVDVTYDPEGKILAYHGAPIHLTNTTKQDEGLQAQVEEWRKPFEEFAAEEIGTTNVVLDQSTCQKQECSLGDLVSDSILQYRVDSGSQAAFAFTNAGGIRATIDAGPITRGEVLTSFPFGNAVVEVKYSGTDLWKIFEGLVSGVNQFNQRNVTSFFQISRGIKVEYDPSKVIGERLVRLTVGDKPVDKEAQYTVVTVDFITGGGDNIVEPVQDVVILDTLDEVLVDHIRKASPIDFKLDGRITTVSGGAATSTGDEPAQTTTPNGTERGFERSKRQ